MTRILVPYDGSEAASRALRFAIGRAPEQRPAEVHLIHVLPAPIGNGSPAGTGIDIRELRAAQLAQGRSTLEAAEHALAAIGIPFQSHLQFGSVATVVVEQAQQLGCDHIVMGSRGLGTMKGMLLGSVATGVAHLSHVPVTLVR